MLAWPWMALDRFDATKLENEAVPPEWYFGWAGLVAATGLIQQLLRRHLVAQPVLIGAGMLFDVVGVAFLIAHEGGLYSLFSLFYFGVIAGTTAMLGRRPAFVAAVSCAASLLIGSWVEGESLVGAAPRIISDVSLRVFAFFLMAEMVFRTTRYRQLEIQQERVLDTVRAGVLILGPDGDLRSLNPAARQMLGDVEGLPAAGFLKGLGSGSAWEETHSNRRWVCLYSPLPDGGSVLVIEDLTELYDARERAARDERLAAVGRLAAAFAHEVRNPLAALSGAVQLLAEDGRSPMLDLALSEAGRMERLVGDFLGSTQLSVVRPVPVRLDALVATVVAATAVDRRYRGLSIVQEVEPVQVQLDPDRFRQVLENLLLNAAQAMPNGGVAVVRVRRDTHDGGDRAVLEVEDEGPGLPAEELQKIFDPFYTKRAGGTGLGLAIVDHAVRGHGGTILAEQGSRGGLRFVISLPIEPLRPRG